MTVLFGVADTYTATSVVASGTPTALYSRLEATGQLAPKASGTATHAYFRINEGANSVRQVRCVVWDASGNLLSQAVATPTTSPQTISAEFSPSFAVDAAQTYRIGIQASDGNMRLAQYDGTNATFSLVAGTTTPPAFDEAVAVYTFASSNSSNRRGMWITDESATTAITSVDYEVITPTTVQTIYGTGFPPLSVLLSPTNDRTDVGAVAQTVGADPTETAITLGAAILPAGVVSGDTLYYFVQGQDSTWSGGFPVTYSTQPTLSTGEVFDAALGGFSFRFTTDTGNGTAIWAIYSTSAERNAATVASIQAEIAAPNISLARGTFAVATAGVQTVAGVAGLGAAQTRYVRVFHDGDVTA